ncbi:hypothetical protein K490DRAFT_56713 [Saccharata proteae CBS 121410]|uniref:Fork-head domain-containing protein n=1 Tax=Saccharata proteae CBS 121410 TaxID=1314787 RepID=A0A9P4LVL3_9PEZI|nr:hypothetical protein K490DRAFT_56713 [Saccharata proteae CBS 121410]
MAATRRHQPALQIYHDPAVAYDHRGEVADAEAALLSALAPVTHLSSAHHTLLNPTMSGASGQSPLKPRGQSSSPPSHALSERNINFNCIPPPRQPGFPTDSLEKRPSSSHMSAATPSRPQSALCSQYQHAAMDKENHFGAIYADHIGQYSDPLYGYKSNNKRTLQDAAPLRDNKVVKTAHKTRQTQDDDHLSLPAPELMPLVEDEYGAGQKPPHNYATLIAMAILRAPDRRLTLAQIYKWISDTFSYYRPGESGWQNSIRHNLSLNKSFVKQERPKEDPGKGSYWTIKPGYEKGFFVKEKPRRVTDQGTSSFMPSINSDLPRPSTAPGDSISFGVYPSSSMQPAHVGESIDSSKFPDETELSSDATIPASDPALHEGHDASGPENDMPPPSQHLRSSPPPGAEIHSSPPPALSRNTHAGTPPRVPRFPSNSRSGGRKRKFSALGDSGYYSSIESSAIKGHPPGQLTSEADVDRPAKKRGRAEEEIARMRGSSYDSPTKNRPVFAQPASQLPSSSPFRPFEKNGNELQAPLTPAVVFKKPAKPPASVSPNTNLRNHRDRIRQMLGSPDKSLSFYVGEDPLWSPAFKLPDEENFQLHEGDFNTTFDVFNESPVRRMMARGSPQKGSAKRPSISRATTSSGVLADITGSRANVLQSPAATPWLKPSSSRVRNFFSQPSAPSPIKPSGNDELFGVELHSDDSEEGFDILQGFAKIGAAASRRNDESPTKRAPVRPGVGRSTTSLF